MSETAIVKQHAREQAGGIHASGWFLLGMLSLVGISTVGSGRLADAFQRSTSPESTDEAAELAAAHPECRPNLLSQIVYGRAPGGLADQEALRGCKLLPPNGPRDLQISRSQGPQ